MAGRLWKRCSSTSPARTNGSNRRRRRNDAPERHGTALNVSRAATLCHAAATPLHSAWLPAPPAGALLFADHADDHLGLHVHFPRHPFGLGGASRGRAARRSAALGRSLPRSARRVALVHGGDVVAQPWPSLR